jgi:hypothetical protein
MRGAELHAKLTLVQQLKQLSKQHEQVLQAYERKVEEKLAEAARQGAGGAGKRMGAPLNAEGPEAKRQRQLAERDQRRKHIWVGTAAAAVLCTVHRSLRACCMEFWAASTTSSCSLWHGMQYHPAAWQQQLLRAQRRPLHCAAWVRTPLARADGRCCLCC